MPPLPAMPRKVFEPVGCCIYCGAADRLQEEHIIPFALGGNWILPSASCEECAKKTGAFEGAFCRPILGPLRIHHGFPTRRPNQRPTTLPVSFKKSEADEWETHLVPIEEHPLLTSLFYFPNLPEIITGFHHTEGRHAASRQVFCKVWNDPDKFQGDLRALAASRNMWGAQVAASVDGEPLCLTLAKIAHAYTVAEIGLSNFKPLLVNLILSGDCSNRIYYIGGELETEPENDQLHEVSFYSSLTDYAHLIVVKIKLLSCLGFPTYYAVSGMRFV